MKPLPSVPSVLFVLLVLGLGFAAGPEPLPTPIGRFSVQSVTVPWSAVSNRGSTRETNAALVLMLDTSSGETWLLAPSGEAGFPLCWYKLQHAASTTNHPAQYLPEPLRASFTFEPSAVFDKPVQSPKSP